MKKLATMITTLMVLLVGTSAVTGHANAVTADQVKAELVSLKAAIENISTSDLKKPVELDNFKKALQKTIAKISKELDKQKLDKALKMLKSVFHKAGKKLTDSALNTIESAMPTTMGAINAARR